MYLLLQRLMLNKLCLTRNFSRQINLLVKGFPNTSFHKLGTFQRYEISEIAIYILPILCFY